MEQVRMKKNKGTHSRPACRKDAPKATDAATQSAIDDAVIDVARRFADLRDEERARQAISSVRKSILHDNELRRRDADELRVGLVLSELIQANCERYDNATTRAHDNRPTWTIEDRRKRVAAFEDFCAKNPRKGKVNRAAAFVVGHSPKKLNGETYTSGGSFYGQYTADLEQLLKYDAENKSGK